MSEKPTIFFAINYGSSIRNMVSGGVLGRLSDSGYRLVLFSVNEKDRKAVEAELPDDCVIEELGPVKYRGLIRSLQRMRTYIWRTKVSYNELLIRYGKRPTPKTYLQYGLGHLLRFIPQKWWRTWNAKLATWERGDELIARYNPVAVLISNPLGDENAIIDYARGRGIYTACVLESWDNLTNRGALYSFPHDMFVWNELVKRQAVAYHGYEADHVLVTGIPSFDLYADKSRYPDESEWRRDNDLPESGPVILYSLSSKHIYPDEDIVIRHLVEARDDGRLPKDAHILVRFHPRDYEEMKNNYADIPGISLQSPSLEFSHRVNDPSMGSPMMLASTVHYADVAVNVFSSMCLDCMCNDTPVVVVNYDAGDRPFSRSVKNFLNFEHIKELLSFDAVLVAESPHQLVDLVAKGLADPEINLAQRQACVAAETYGLDGQASDRSARLISERISAHVG